MMENLLGFGVGSGIGSGTGDRRVWQYHLYNTRVVVVSHMLTINLLPLIFMLRGASLAARCRC